MRTARLSAGASLIVVQTRNQEPTSRGSDRRLLICRPGLATASSVPASKLHSHFTPETEPRSLSERRVSSTGEQGTWLRVPECMTSQSASRCFHANKNCVSSDFLALGGKHSCLGAAYLSRTDRSFFWTAIF